MRIALAQRRSDLAGPPPENEAPLTSGWVAPQAGWWVLRSAPGSCSPNGLHLDNPDNARPFRVARRRRCRPQGANSTTQTTVAALSKTVAPPTAPFCVFGQAINPATSAMARINSFLNDMEAEIAVGDTLERPTFTDGSRKLTR